MSMSVSLVEELAKLEKRLNESFDRKIEKMRGEIMSNIAKNREALTRDYVREQLNEIKKSKTLKERLIDDVIDNFNFERVLKVMRTLDWRWANNVPTLDDLVKVARQLLNDAWENNNRIATGGLEADCIRDENWLELRFIVENYDTCEEYVNGESK